ncbi:ParB/Srx family N-terminal domain-containing protein [uncultured Cedecea sp.]|uniref:ParB/Srx family N-terminal domain-containing protein n=1 Tax=uncultured Cedecea sp. TaxID=988762 RepID=UPI0026117BD9|nr:ParB/Srx family N-terminal domain-containing protein [uncultured Cedecea sp.]
MYLNKNCLYQTGTGLLLLSGLMFYSLTLHAAPSPSYTEAKPGDIIQIRLSELHPTQMSVGKLQVNGTLAEYAEDTKTLFKTLCKTQGAGKLREINSSSTPDDPSSYTCELAAGTEKKQMNTVDIGPEGKLYLTDGHHGLNSLWNAPKGGGDVRLTVLVEQNLSHNSQGTALTQAQFEQKMAELKHFLPFDVQGQAVTFSELPTSLGMSHFQDDPYRSMLHYLRGIAYDKPEKNTNPETDKPYPAVPFLEFYWGELLRSKMDLTHYDLNKQDDYIKALKEAAVVMTTVTENELIGHSGKTAAALGQLNKVDKKRLAKLAKPNSALAKALEYQARH